MSFTFVELQPNQRTPLPAWVTAAALALLVFSKWAVGVQAASHALLADALASAAQLGLLLMSRTGRWPVADSPQGLAARQRVWTTVGAGALVTAAFSAAWYCIRVMNVPHPPPTIVSACVAGVAIVLEKGAYRQLFGPPNLGEFRAWYHPSNALPSNLALVGISLSILGGPGYEWADDWAALGICALLVGNAYRLLQPASVAGPTVRRQEWKARLQCCTQTIPGITLAEAHLEPSETGSVLHVWVRVSSPLTVAQEHAIAQQVQTVLAPVQPPSSTLLVRIVPS